LLAQMEVISIYLRVKKRHLVLVLTLLSLCTERLTPEQDLVPNLELHQLNQIVPQVHKLIIKIQRKLHFFKLLDMVLEPQKDHKVNIPDLRSLDQAIMRLNQSWEKKHKVKQWVAS